MVVGGGFLGRDSVQEGRDAAEHQCKSGKERCAFEKAPAADDFHDLAFYPPIDLGSAVERILGQVVVRDHLRFGHDSACSLLRTAQLGSCARGLCQLACARMRNDGFDQRSNDAPPPRFPGTG